MVRRSISCVVRRGCLLWSGRSLGKTVSLCPASFCTARPNLPVTPGVSWLPTFAFQWVFSMTRVFSWVSFCPTSFCTPRPNLSLLHTGKDSDAGRDWGQEEKGTTEDEMAGWHHRLDGLEFEWTPGVGDGQGGLATPFCSICLISITILWQDTLSVVNRSD